MRAVLDQVLQGFARPVEDLADLQALRLSQLVAQFQPIRRRRHARKDVVGDGAQRKHVEVLARVPLGQGFGRHVGRAGVFYQTIDVRRGRHLPRGPRGGTGVAVAGLPVENFDLLQVRARIGHQDALRAERPMHDLLVVGEADNLGDLPQQAQLRVDVELVFSLGQKVIEPDAARVVLEDQRRADFVLSVAVGPQDAGMGQRFHELVFPLGGPGGDLAIFLGGASANHIQPHPPPRLGKLHVPGLPVLIIRAFADQLFQQVIADLVAPLRGTNARLLHRLGDHLGRGAVVVAFGRRLKPGAVSPKYGRHDAGSGLPLALSLAVSKADLEPRSCPAVPVADQAPSKTPAARCREPALSSGRPSAAQAANGASWPSGWLRSAGCRPWLACRRSPKSTFRRRRTAVPACS